MLYGIDEDTVDGVKTAVRSCRKCEYTEPISRENPIVYEHSLREDKSVRLVMNPNMKNDPTLDHFSNILCPNKECSSRTGAAKPDVVAVEINEKQLVWMYQCVNCDTTWKQTATLK
jgi:DNA-directed RNA polymerase subunit M/transcription elongation factor TFIIS